MRDEYPRPAPSTAFSMLFALALLISAVDCGRDSAPPIARPRVPPPRALAPETGAPRLSGADLKLDADTLRRTYEALHPGLHRYNTPAQLDAAFAALDARIGGGATLEEAFRAFSELAAKIRCGHTFLNPTNQTKAVQQALFDRPHLPVHFRWLDRRMIVTGSLSPDVDLSPGTEIVTIDGTPASEVLVRLMTVARADGANDDKRIASLERRGLDRYEPFDVAYPLFFPSTGDSFALDVVDPSGRARRVSVRGRAPEPKAEPKDSSPNGEPAAPLWALRFLDDRTGYLRMPTWVTYDSKWDWKGDLQRTFVALAARRATSLVVDLRGNEGGTDVGDTILGHFIDARLATASFERWTRYRRVPDELRENLRTWDKSFFDWGEAARPRGDGFFTLVRFDDDEGGDVLAPLLPRATAKLIVLVDAANSSATFQFAQLVQQHHLGTLMGEPTGGNRRGINGGAFFFLKLPRSGLELDLPLIGRFPSDGHPERLPDEGLIPDIVVRETAADIAAGRDAALEAAVARAHR